MVQSYLLVRSTNDSVPLTYMSSRVLYGGVSVDIGELAEAEPVIVLVGWIGEPVDDNRVVVGVVDLAHPRVQLVVRDRGPVHWLLGRERAPIYKVQGSVRFRQDTLFIGTSPHKQRKNVPKKY